ncbi:Glycosyl hydrolase family 20, domain 2 [Cnuella takakiae]|uniref:Glycosyl hydrolase family 20, domain 2 n=2 Tax=Cnuella takakiae TaxID=1302690 RepID=A0A1M4YYF8_9BACT|nr:Glycosyl hydrolase family 20, domain 2 [Cnuella takakiae]
MFMNKNSCLLIVALLGCCSFVFSQAVQIHYDKTSPLASYAAELLGKAIRGKGYTLSSTQPRIAISIAANAPKLGEEAYAISGNGHKITVSGGDYRGMIYGCLSLAEKVRNGGRLEAIKTLSEKPRYALRAIKFDLPWDTYRHSDALDLHYETCKDLAYWEAFLDMMVENRINALTLWNLHPYTFMIRPKSFPEASPFSDAELQEWKTLFAGIFRMAKERALDTYIIPFNIFVSPAFSKAHNVAMDNLQHDFFVKGDTSELVKRYTRECVAQMLQEYPGITGMGLTLGEGMGGMTPEEREAWMKETIIEGMRLSGRKLKLIHRIPFSSTTNSLGVTSVETERLTRKEIAAQGQLSFLQPPIFADLKYNWSHAHSTPTLVKVHGGKLYDTYFKPEPQNYKINWTARNEDFFCLRWGVPDFVRSHIATNAQPYVGGYMIGSETYIPAKDYFTRPGIAVNWKYAFERQWLFYKIWGRLLYNPQTPDAVFQSAFLQRYGKEGTNLLQAFSLAGKTPLRLGSLFDFTMDLTLYSEGFMALDDKVKRVEYISVDRLIDQPVTDPNYVSVAAYVKAAAAKQSFATNKVTPPKLAAMLEQDCAEALRLVKGINTSGNPALPFEVADVQAWAYMGLHFAEKIKGAVALQAYRTKGGAANKQKAIMHLEAALKYWDEVVRITRPLYNDMPLVHLSEQNGVRSEENKHLLFHWEKIRPDVAKDVEVARAATNE